MNVDGAIPAKEMYHMEKTFDEMMAELKEGEPLGGRKLTFREKCGAFAALYGGAANQVIARAFGISPQTVSKLSGCLENDPDPYRYAMENDPNDPGARDLTSDIKVLRDHNRNRNADRMRHYPDVAAEFEALGKEEFTRLYYTKRIHDRIVLAKAELRAERKARRK